MGLASKTCASLSSNQKTRTKHALLVHIFQGFALSTCTFVFALSFDCFKGLPVCQSDKFGFVSQHSIEDCSKFTNHG